MPAGLRPQPEAGAAAAAHGPGIIHAFDSSQIPPASNSGDRLPQVCSTGRESTEFETLRSMLSKARSKVKKFKRLMEAKDKEAQKYKMELETKEAEWKAKDAEAQIYKRELVARNIQFEAKDAALKAKDAALEAKNAALEAKDREAQKYKQESERLNGGYVLGMSSLNSQFSEFPQLSFTSFIQRFNLSEFYDMLPTETSHPPAYKAPRSQPKHKLEQITLSAYESAHIIPLAAQCNRNWIPLFSPMFESQSCWISPATLAAEYFLYGVEVDGARARKSGMISSARNFINVINESDFF